MILSRLLLNPLERNVARDLGSPDEMHKTLWNLFSPEKPDGANGRRVLFRTELHTETVPPSVLVLSWKAPQWKRLPSGYIAGNEAGCCHSIDYEPVPAGRSGGGIPIHNGDIFQFRLVANPTRRVGKFDHRQPVPKRKIPGKRVGLLKEEEQCDWLIRKGTVHGFELGRDLQIEPLGMVRSTAKGAKRKWLSVRYSGSIRVVEPAAFCDALLAGIGPAKGFGFGLLSIKLS
ncbi:type I-E CRISPR-associated protein Cas6/Cse3/CasE [Stratiformator vulcanicus]|uniref:CRISPR-associated endoribonuclease Cse3 n=1 Tax=Stratiformator vulcanicus TaxID=2527980 RepID=A0A517R116_9PLAN|nr:type I-E CRISPR-associated protein Cas6/Cse3/CasE [Stratiformator vulcanicus]QDT37589.1 CRISPR-associated endoribonuclease Cse3 [Stratiformator vulcanicus]